jgi:hypothetical protein
LADGVTVELVVEAFNQLTPAEQVEALKVMRRVLEVRCR